MMLRSRIALLGLLVLGGIVTPGMAQPDRTGPGTSSTETVARIRLAQMMIGADSLALRIARLDGSTVMRRVVPAGTVSETVEIAPGRYAVEVGRGERTLARLTVGLGGGTQYTVLAAGTVPPRGVSLERPLLDQLRWVFGGAETAPDYVGLPQLRLLTHRDPEPGRAAVRVVHAAPAVVDLRIARRTDTGLKTLAGRVSYPHAAPSISLMPGRHSLVLTRPGSHVPLHVWTDSLANATETMLFVTGGPGSTDGLRVVNDVFGR